MTAFFPITLQDQIASVKREIKMRESVYPHLVSQGKMKQDFADRELATMRAVLDTLEGLADRDQATSLSSRLAGPVP